MHPILFEINGWPVYSYGVLLAAAYLAALQLAVVRGRRRGLDGTKIMDLGIYLIISALVGAKLLYLVVDFDHFRSQPKDLFSLFRVGGVFYGGLIFALIAAIWLVRRYQLRIWTVADLFAPGIALGHVIGRLGCLLAGCCYGLPTSRPWGITFTDQAAALNSGTPLGTPLHPTQLYDAGGELLIMILLLATERRGKPFEGRTFWLYMLLYAISRYIIEFYRGDPRGTVLMFSTSQFISIILAPLAILMLVYLGRAQAPAPKEARKAA